MSFEQHLAIPTVVDLSSSEKVEALKELANAFCKAIDLKKPKIIAEEILKREEAASTFIGAGLALPQARGPIKEEFAIVVGRSMAGIEYNAARGALAHVIVLIVSREDADNTRQIQLLAEIADFFKTDAVREKILAPKLPVDIKTVIKELKKGDGSEEKSARRQRKPGMPILRIAMSLARELKANTIMIFADAVRENDFLDQIKTKTKLIVVTSNRTRFDLMSDRRIKGFLQAPAIPASRTGQIKIGILLALSRSLISREDRIVCISGNTNNNLFDTVVVIDVAKEYDFFFTEAQSIVPPDVEPEAKARQLARFSFSVTPIRSPAMCASSSSTRSAVTARRNGAFSIQVLPRPSRSSPPSTGPSSLPAMGSCFRREATSGRSRLTKRVPCRAGSAPAMSRPPGSPHAPTRSPSRCRNRPAWSRCSRAGWQ
jgi:mannitol/fructose-specific phosphotransferase system IIA component (Ntr-type)